MIEIKILLIKEHRWFLSIEVTGSQFDLCYISNVWNKMFIRNIYKKVYILTLTRYPRFNVLTSVGIKLATFFAVKSFIHINSWQWDHSNYRSTLLVGIIRAPEKVQKTLGLGQVDFNKFERCYLINSIKTYWWIFLESDPV